MNQVYRVLQICHEPRRTAVSAATSAVCFYVWDADDTSERLLRARSVARPARKKTNKKMTNEANKLMKTKDRLYKRSQTNPNESIRIWVRFRRAAAWRLAVAPAVCLHGRDGGDTSERWLRARAATTLAARNEQKNDERSQ
jgi:hypothetical protein